MVKTNVTVTCPSSEIALGLQHSMDIYVTVVNATSGLSTPRLGLSLTECDAYCPPHEDRDGLVGVCAPACFNDTDCSGSKICCFQGCGLNCVDPLTSLPKSFPDRGCPSSSQVVDRVVAQCAGYVLPGIRWLGMVPCQNYASFNECLSRIQLPAECQENHLWESLGAYSSYIASVMDGFDPVECKMAHQCGDKDYIKTDIMPHCRNHTDMFLEYVWDDGCWYFDALVFCVVQRLESKQVYCNHQDIREVVTDYTHELSNYDWHYEDRCQRHRWLAELHFENETFVAEMERNVTDVYRVFVRKYSDIINAILSRFGGGHVVKLHEGSVVVLLSFWAPEDPYDQIKLVLQQQFEPDMVNITIGKVTEDEDQNRCLDTVYINEIAVGQCRKELQEIMNATEKCR